MDLNNSQGIIEPMFTTSRKMLLTIYLKNNFVENVPLKFYCFVNCKEKDCESTVVPATRDPLIRDGLVVCDCPWSAPNSIFCTFCTPI